MLWTEIGTREAVACLRHYESARYVPPRRCYDPIRWFVVPSRLPWTRMAASYRAEELSARIAVSDYLDAAIGRPDRKALGQTGEALDRADRVVRKGSTRLE